MNIKRKLGIAMVLALLMLTSVACSNDKKLVEDITKKSMMGQQAEGIKNIAAHVEQCNGFYLYSEEACATDKGITMTIENGGKQGVWGIKIAFSDSQEQVKEVLFRDVFIRRGSQEYTFDAPFLTSKILLIPVVFEDERNTSSDVAIECTDRAIVLDDLQPCVGYS